MARERQQRFGENFSPSVFSPPAWWVRFVSKQAWQASFKKETIADVPQPQRPRAGERGPGVAGEVNPPRAMAKSR